MIAQSFPMFDANWLLATLVQSSAALVAIVGGFLISRVVDLASRRDQLASQIRELSASISLKGSAYAEQERAHTELLAVGFFMDHFEDLMRAEVSARRDMIFDRHPVAAEEIEGQVLALSTRGEEVVFELHEAGKNSREMPYLHELRRDQVVRFDDDEEWLWAHAWEVAEEAHRPPAHLSQGAYARIIGRINAGVSSSYATENSRRLGVSASRLSTLVHESDVLRASMESARRDLESLSTPEEVSWAAHCLTWLALFGIGVPIVWMSTGQTSIQPALRGLLVGAFGVGVIWLVGIIYMVIRSVDRAGTEDDQNSVDPSSSSSSTDAMKSLS